MPVHRIELPTTRLLFTGVAGAMLLAACANDVPTAANALTSSLSAHSGASARVSVCHRPRSTPAILEVAAPALAAHLAHGDYVTTLVVNREDHAPVGDGVHFRRITDAVKAARDTRLLNEELVSAACRVTITVAAGRYEGTTDVATGDLEHFPILVDVPDLTLQGALDMQVDDAGRATGVSVNGAETVLAPLANLPSVGASIPLLIANGHPVGSAAHRLIVRGFVFTSGPNALTNVSGQGVLGVRVNDLLIRGNRFEPGFSESIDLRGSTGDVLENHLRGPGGSCDVCLAAPGNYRAMGNRLISGGVVGFTAAGVVGFAMPAGVEPLALPATAELWTEVRNNEVRDYRRLPVGVGIRVETSGNQAPNVINTIHSVIQDNLIINNRFGIIIHAGFPVANTVLQSNANVTLGGNIIEGSCQTEMLVTFSRHQRTLGLNNVLPYLRSSVNQLTLNGNLAWDDVWYDHPAMLGNTLLVDGQFIPNGKRQFYSPATCPAL